MNIILLIADTYRYDNLFDRADMPVRTPHLDSFSERAVSLSNLYTGSFPTIPQRTDLTTGRIGWPWYGWQPLDNSSKNNMPGLLREKGYVSQLICDCPHLFNSRFQHTFDGAMALRGQEGDTPFLRMNHEFKEIMPPEKTRPRGPFQGHNLVDLHKWTNQRWRDNGEADRFPPRTAETAVEWLEENYQFDPFLLWVDFFDPHEPWDPPEYMVKHYDPDYDGTPMLHPNYGKADDYTAAELKNLRAHYCAEAELVDRWVGRILQKIDDLRLWENSVVVFTTDHGFSIGEHNRTGKSCINDNDNRPCPLYPAIAHIPFMIAAPGLKGGTTVDTLAQPADILPTLLDLTGLDITPPEPFHGASFAPNLRGETTDSIRDFTVSASRIPGCPAALDGKITPVLYTREWAYAPVTNDGTQGLYDLRTDPGATQNLATDKPDVVKHLQETFINWLQEMDAPQDTIDLWKKA